MVRYHGYYSNKSRGMRKKEGEDDAVPSPIESFDVSPNSKASIGKSVTSSNQN